MYRLTELYLPRNPDIRARMEKFNRDMMRTPNDDNADFVARQPQMRVMRREVKKELKIAEQKIKHQIKYCSVPSSILDEAKYRYTPGMTSRDLRP